MTPPPIDPKLAALLGLAATGTACDKEQASACLKIEIPYTGPCLEVGHDPGDTGFCLTAPPDTGDTADTRDTGFCLSEEPPDTGEDTDSGTQDTDADEDTGDTPDTGNEGDGQGSAAEILENLRDSVRQKLHGSGVLPESLFGEPPE
jgi:hypothetical protein